MVEEAATTVPSDEGASGEGEPTEAEEAAVEGAGEEPAGEHAEEPGEDAVRLWLGDLLDEAPAEGDAAAEPGGEGSEEVQPRIGQPEAEEPPAPEQQDSGLVPRIRPPADEPR